MTSLPPALIFFAGAALAASCRGRLQSAVLLAVPIVGALNLWQLGDGTTLTIGILDLTIMPLRVDALSLLFGWLFHIAAALALLFALHLRDTTQQVAALVYAGSALGAVFAGDLLTLFVFWELLALSSVFLIWARRTERAMASGFRYLVIQVLAGGLLLSGALWHLAETGSLVFGYIGLAGPASLLIFLAFGIKCAFPLLHNWLTDAYAEATPTGTVFLAAFTTKVAVYALARAFPGAEPLIYIGAAMTLFPIFYAVIENDLRRVLAYSMINQIGFMVCGIGLGSALALNGAVSHAFNDVIFKGLLFMAMGSVLHVTGRINGSELGGLWRTMPRTTVLCIVGAASISAFPLFSGFVSKSMVMQAALEEGHEWIWLVLLFASAGVFHHAGIKIPYFAFFAHDRAIAAREPPANMLAAMAIAAALCILIGSFPGTLYSMLPAPVDYVPYDWTHVIAQLQLLFFAALAFVFLQLTGLYPPELVSVNIDAEWAYRWLGRRVARAMTAAATVAHRAFDRASRSAVSAANNWIYRHHGPEGVLARTWPTGSTVLMVTICLGAYLVFYLF